MMNTMFVEFVNSRPYCAQAKGCSPDDYTGGFEIRLHTKDRTECHAYADAQHLVDSLDTLLNACFCNDDHNRSATQIQLINSTQGALCCGKLNTLYSIIARYAKNEGLICILPAQGSIPISVQGKNISL